MHAGFAWVNFQIGFCLEEMMRFAQRSKRVDTLELEIRNKLASRSVVLIGMPGCGKSAVGRRLAPRLALPFVDADDEIERAAGKTIKDIFAEHGEPYFREGERKVIARLLAAGPQVLATGGGAMMDPETRANVHRAGISVWVKAELGVLVRRVAKRSNRPLFEGRDPQAVMKALMDVRDPVFASADIVVESREVPHEVIVDEIIEALSKSPVLAEAAAGEAS